MKETVSESRFLDAFKDCDQDDQFSQPGLRMLFAYLEDLEEGTGAEIELDVIAFCCDYSEHSSALACVQDLGYPFDGETEEGALEYLRNETTVIEFDGGVIIQGF